MMQPLCARCVVITYFGMLLNPLKGVMAMADSAVENHQIGNWQDRLVLEICLGIVRVKETPHAKPRIGQGRAGSRWKKPPINQPIA